LKAFKGRERGTQECVRHILWGGIWVSNKFLVGAGGGCVGSAQSLTDLPHLKSYSAERVSSNNAYVGSNDDSKAFSG